MNPTVAVRERPILFSGSMVRAILDGRKTQTRRVIRNPGRLDGLMLSGEEQEWCPYGRVGDRLWVRETWSVSGNGAIYKATDCDGSIKMAWRPSIHMPRWASRLTLEITDVRVQRLQEIGPGDCEAEGIRLPVAPSEKHPGMGIPLLCVTGPLSPSDFCPRHPRDWALADYWRFEYASLWDTLNAKRGHGWEINPWVWAISFRTVEEGS